MRTDDELLQDYLDGTLPSEQADVLEQRLLDDADLATRLDAIAGVRMQLAGVDDVDLPAGLDERLAARLTAERGVPSLDARRQRRRIPLAAVGLAAAAIVAVAIVGGGLIRSGGGGLTSGGDLALESTQAESAADADATAPASSAAGDTMKPEAYSATEAGINQRSAALDSAAPALPDVRDSRVALADADAVRARYRHEVQENTAVAGATGGTDDDARPPAPTPYGGSGACLKAIADGAVVELIETAKFAGDPAFVFVTSSGDDRRAIVVATDGCDTLATVDL